MSCNAKINMIANCISILLISNIFDGRLKMIEIQYDVSDKAFFLKFELLAKMIIPFSN